MCAFILLNKMKSILKFYRLEQLFGSLFDGAKASKLKIYDRLIETVKILFSLIFLFVFNFSSKLQSLIFSIWTLLVF